jgi:cellulose biosynthesis protein BcsQ
MRSDPGSLRVLISDLDPQQSLVSYLHKMIFYCAERREVPREVAPGEATTANFLLPGSVS